MPRLRHTNMEIIIASTMIVVPAALIFIGLQMAFVYPNASPDWPQTEGRIENQRLFGRFGQDDRMICGEVTYSYLVSGETYHASQQERYFQQSRTREWLAQYPVGKRVTVHYHPQNPRRGVIEPRYRHPKALLILSIGIILGALDLVLYGPELRELIRQNYHF